MAYRLAGKPNAGNRSGIQKDGDGGDAGGTRVENVDRMGRHDVVGAAPIFGNRGLPVRRCRDHHDVAGLGEGPVMEELHDGVAAGEPRRNRRHFESDVGLQQLGKRRDVRVFECRAVAVEQGTALGVIGLDGVFFGGFDLGEAGPGPLQGAVDRGGRGFAKFGDFGGAEPHDVAQNQDRSLARR